jgi:troponin I
MSYRRATEEEEEVSSVVPDLPQQRRGGPQGDDDEEEEETGGHGGGGGGGGPDDEDKRKREERERKKAEVRKRLEEAGRAKKAKKGFLTPERKKKLRQLLMKKAAEDLKQQQLVKEQERQRVLQQRIPALPNVDSIANQAELQKLAEQFHKKIIEIEESKYDLEYSVRQKDFEINELTIAVNDLRGKFVKPTLKKVSKYDNKFKKMAEKKEDKVDFRGTLKQVKTAESIMEEIKATGKEKEAPEWKKKGPGKGEKAEE